jgi:DNA repair exonuclease SbcCD ATPase subunit
MPRKPTTAHAELERLHREAADQMTQRRHAEDDVARVEAQVQRLAHAIETAYDDEKPAAKLRQDLKAAEEELEDRRHRLNARTRRAERAVAAVAAFQTEHARDLLAEREPEATALAGQLQEALERVVSLDGQWHAHAQATNQLVAQVPGAQPRYDGGPAEHPFSSIVKALRHALSEGAEVPAPTPSWQGRAVREQQNHTHRVLRAQRKRDQQAVEDLQRGAA